jgi:hypothetical protein
MKLDVTQQMVDTLFASIARRVHTSSTEQVRHGINDLDSRIRSSFINRFGDSDLYLRALEALEEEGTIKVVRALGVRGTLIFLTSVCPAVPSARELLEYFRPQDGGSWWGDAHCHH